jgi:uncharacterized protein YjbJ (UPF0337 family)
LLARSDGQTRKVTSTARGDVMSDLEQMKGRAKQAVGDLTDDEDLKREGKIDETAGKAKEKLGDLKDKADDAIDRTKDKFTR